MTLNSLPQPAPNGDAGTNGQRFLPARDLWTAEYLAFVLPLTPDRVFQPAINGWGGATSASRHEWRWIDYAQRLTWVYGAEEALRRLNSHQPSLEPSPLAAAAA